MKPTSISAEALFEAHREALHWAWIAGHAHPERRFDDDAVRDAQSAADHGPGQGVEDRDAIVLDGNRGGEGFQQRGAASPHHLVAVGLCLLGLPPADREQFAQLAVDEDARAPVAGPLLQQIVTPAVQRAQGRVQPGRVPGRVHRAYEHDASRARRAWIPPVTPVSP